MAEAQNSGLIARRRESPLPRYFAETHGGPIRRREASRGLVFALSGRRDRVVVRSSFPIWRIDVDGKNLQKVASSPLFDQPLSWKPEAPTD